MENRISIYEVQQMPIENNITLLNNSLNWKRDNLNAWCCENSSYWKAIDHIKIMLQNIQLVEYLI